MKRVPAFVALVAVALVIPALRADVKTVQKTTFKLEGFLGRFVNSGKDGITSTIAVKGNRMSRLNDATGEIVDLGEEKVYQIDVKKKEYKVKTFAQLRQEMEKARADAEKQAQSAQPQQKSSSQNAPEYEYDVDIKETGQHKTIAGREAKEVVMTITAHLKDKKVEEGGGTVMTTTSWMTPKVAALDELMAFEMKYFNAIYGSAGLGVDMQQMASISAMLPGFGALASKMATEGRRMQGTPLASSTVVESVKSAEDMKAAQQQADQPKSGGLGGLLAGKIGPKQGPVQQRSVMYTSTSEYASIDTAASDTDVAMPAGFKERK